LAENKFYRAMGRRKTSTALVRLYPGKGEIVVNGKSIGDYFGREPLHNYIRQPLISVDRLKAYDIHANIKGGGESGQAGALRHGIAKALTIAEEQLRGPLKAEGFLTRDPRMKERKKYGQRGARARFQFSKR
jgi:small subunit ribosomal protein S9